MDAGWRAGRRTFKNEGREDWGKGGGGGDTVHAFRGLPFAIFHKNHSTVIPRYPPKILCSRSLTTWFEVGMCYVWEISCSYIYIG